MSSDSRPRAGVPFLGSRLFLVGVLVAFAVAVAVILYLGVRTVAVGSAIEVTMWSSGEKMTYLPDLVAQFNKEEHKLPKSNKRIHVTAVQVNSGPMSDYLVGRLRDNTDFPSGVAAPQIISPSVDSWLTRVNYLTGTQVFDLPATKPLALTPVVIAMYQEMAQALGWPQKEIGWSDIIDLAHNPDGWAAVPGARAEWGKKPLLAWTDPSVSSTARSALFATYAAAAGKPADQLTSADVGNPRVQTYVHDLQDAVDHYFPETLKLQAKLFDGPRFIQFVPIEEYNLVWLKDGLVSDGTATKPLERKMVAIYPKEGTVWHNNPGGILQNVPWTSPQQQEAAAVWVDYLLQPPQQAKVMEKGFRPANPGVPYGPKLSAEYGIDPAQPKKVLGSVDPAVAEDIVTRWPTVKKPSVVVVVLDTSGSMAGDKIDQARHGAEAFLDSISDNSYVGLVTFSGGVNSKVDVGPIVNTKFQIVDTVERTSATGSTALYDALRVAVQMADGYPAPGEVIRGVVLLSDGANTAGTATLCSIVRLQDAQERPLSCVAADQTPTAKTTQGSAPAIDTQHRVAVFSIGYGKDADVETLRVLAEGTNGISTTADPTNVVRVFQVFGKYF